MPARVRHVALSRGEGGVEACPAEAQELFGAGHDRRPNEGFARFDAPSHDALAHALEGSRRVRAREGVFSYSSAHALMAEGFGHGPEAEGASAQGVASSRLLGDDEEAQTPEWPDDADKATNLGSAFHELAQTMVEAGSCHDPARLEALATYWHLSARQHARLEEAIARWERSDLRREVLSFDLVLAEVPFFLKVDSAYGTHVEGAIDLLCQRRDGSEVLVVDYKTGDVGLLAKEVYERHEMQANFYAYVMMAQGYPRVTCAFVCVEREGEDGQPLVVRYAFDKDNPPRV